MLTAPRGKKECDDGVLAIRDRGNRGPADEPRGPRRDRFACLSGRGRNETKPVAADFRVVGRIAALILWTLLG